MILTHPFEREDMAKHIILDYVWQSIKHRELQNPLVLLKMPSPLDMAIVYGAANIISWTGKSYLVASNIFVGPNPLLGPKGAFRTPPFGAFAGASVAGAAVYAGYKSTMSPGATVSHGPFGAVSVVPSLGVFTR